MTIRELINELEQLQKDKEVEIRINNYLMSCYDYEEPEVHYDSDRKKYVII